MGLADAFGPKSALSQIFVWQVAAQIVSSVMGPTLELVTQKVNEENPVVDLTPADLADLVVRSYRDQGDAAREAARSGIDGDKFADLVHLAGTAPGPAELAVALRRGIIPQAGAGPNAISFEQGIREGRIANKWSDMLRELSVQWPTPTDALDALLEGQLSYDEARTLYRRLGGDDQFFQVLFNTRGNAPTPVEALELANRGIIPWDGEGPDVTSYHQAFLEGPWRNKWERPFRALGEYLPPPRTVTAMIAEGSISPQRGAELLAKQGLAPDLVSAYVNGALDQQNKDDKKLTVSQLLDMYSSGLIKSNDVRQLLSALGYSAQSVDWLLAYRDLQRAIAATNAAVSRIHSLFVAHKIDEQTARASLTALQVPGTQVDDIVGSWLIERSANVKTLTPAEIANAWQYEIITIDEALAELVSLGYTPRDAWIYMSIKNKAPLTSQPAQGPAPINPAIGGTQ